MATSGAGGAWARRRRDLSPSLRPLCKLLIFFSYFLLSFIAIKPSLLLPCFKILQIRDREWSWLPASPLPLHLLTRWLSEPVTEESLISKRWSYVKSENGLSILPRSTDPRALAILVEQLPYRCPQTSPISPRSLKQKGSNQATKQLSVKLRLVRSGTLPEPMKKMTTTKVNPSLTAHSRSTILPDRSHKNKHQTPAKDMKKPLSELPSVIFEQSTGFFPISSTGQPPPLRRRRRHLCNGEREQCFIISLNQTSPTNLSWNRATEVLHQSNDIFGQTSNDSRSGPTMGVVTIPLPPPSTLTPTPPSPACRSMPSTMTPANPSCLTLASTTDSTPSIAASPFSHQAATSICPETGKLGFPLLGLSLKAGPLSKSRPNIKRCGPFSLKDWPRHHLGRSLNLLQGFCAYHRRILFQNLSFKLIPISENIIVDDLAKKAIWSMTSGPSMFYVTLFI